MSFFGPIPEGQASGVFNGTHFIILAIMAVLMVGLLFLNKKVKANQKILLIVIATVVTGLEIWKIIFNFKQGRGSQIDSWVPLYYCSLFIPALWLAIIPNEKVSKVGKVFIKTGGLMGGLCYLIYPSTSLGILPLWYCLTIHGLIYHFLMVFTGFFLIIYDTEEVQIKNIIQFLIFFVPLSILAITLSYTLKANFMFYRDAYQLPQFARDIYNVSPPLYVICVFVVYCFTFFLGLLISKLIHKVQKVIAEKKTA